MEGDRDKAQWMINRRVENLEEIGNSFTISKEYITSIAKYLQNVCIAYEKNSNFKPFIWKNELDLHHLLPHSCDARMHRFASSHTRDE